ncbi:MAG: DUF4920 domain-containing protein [Acidobacteria bacterium]|nr:DUF4920 domain-containing protein [Acidobacteriota bacterium]
MVGAQRFVSEIAFLLIVTTALQCGRGARQNLGAPLDPAAAIPLSHLDARTASNPKASVVVAGRVREVCRTSGCWLVLEDASDRRARELFVDLRPEAGFTVNRSMIGRRVYVSGYLVGENPDHRLIALGLVPD